jgi:hypothetical protein
MPHAGIYFAAMPYDYAGVIRFNPPDMGAYEFTPAGIPENITVTGIVTGISTACYNATNTITVAGNGDTFEVQSGGNATLIAWQKILFLPGTKVYPRGNLHAYIELGGSCPVTKSAAFTEADGKSGNNKVNSGVTFTIYPNPVEGKATLFHSSSEVIENVNVEVYDLQGQKVITRRIDGRKSVDLNFSDLVPGLYFVKIVADGHVETIKLVKL